MKKILEFEVVPLEEVLRKARPLEEASPADDVDSLPPLAKPSESSYSALEQRVPAKKRSHR